MTPGNLDFFHNPRAVAVIGASDDPDKIGGRPLRYLREFGFTGRVLPVNPSRTSVQGLPSFPDLTSLPLVPELAVVAVGGENAARAIEECATIGVRGCVILASGFGETGDPQGLALQERMVVAARSSGMRIVGPNSLGLANFAAGAVFGFSTMFIEEPPLDGPIAIISQSGAMSAVPYGLLRRQGLGIRYSHGTGNNADVGVGELAEEVLRDPAIRVMLLYLEDIRDPSSLERAARTALERGVPMIALVGGRSAAGKRAAQSHTGALANEQRVVDAFLDRCGIWRSRNVAEMVDAVALYLKGWSPRGRRLAIVSNSGAVCVLAADAAADEQLELSEFSALSTQRLGEVLPTFATKVNPIDVTAALLTDSSLFGKVLPILAEDAGIDACFVGLPVSGQGYDLERFASDVAEFAAGGGHPVVVATPQPPAAAAFRRAGIVVYTEESAALAALSQFLRHRELIAEAALNPPRSARARLTRIEPLTSLNEVDGLRFLSGLSIDVVPSVLCTTAEQATAAFTGLGGVSVAVKGCPSSATHKSELGLVRLGLTNPDDVGAAASAVLARMNALGVAADGVIVAPMVRAVTEAFVGGHVDPVFGPVVLVGAGGKYVEALGDVRVLLPPFDQPAALRAISRLRIAPLLAGIRGDQATDVDAWAQVAVRLGQALLDDPALASVDVNPLMIGARGSGIATAVDAVVVRTSPFPAGAESLD